MTLTPAAFADLDCEIARQWQAVHGDRKITRRDRAVLLGVSVATSEKILRNTGVDRQTLRVAFDSLGLEWREDLCVFVGGPLVGGTPDDGRTVSPPMPKRTIPKTAYAFVAVIFLLILFVNPPAADRQDLDTSGNVEFNQHLNTATDLFQKARFSDAETEVAVAMRIARTHEVAGGLSSAYRISGDIAAAVGRLEEARQHYRSALTLRQALIQPRQEPAIFEALGVVETRMGLSKEAQDDLGKSLSGYRSFSDEVGVAMACRDLGTLEVRRGERVVARRWFGMAEEAAAGQRKTDIVTDVRSRLALLLRDEGKTAEARKLLQGCLIYWQIKSHPRWVATTLFQLGTVESFEGNNDRAVDLFRRSRELYQSVGDEAGVLRCWAWIDSSKVGSGRPADDGIG